MKQKVLVIPDQVLVDAETIELLQIDPCEWKVGKHGYCYNATRGLMHRHIWKLSRGEIPKKLQIDHINHNKIDNRMENLRLVTPAENQYNRTDIAGYYLRKDLGKYQAQIRIKGRKTNLGVYDTAIEARLAYLKAKEKHHVFLYS